jgi:hypothetical protein
MIWDSFVKCEIEERDGGIERGMKRRRGKKSINYCGVERKKTLS